MHILKVLAVVFISFGVLGCQVKSERDAPIKLSAAEIKTLFIGKTVESFNLVNGNTSFTYYADNGRAYQERYWESRSGKWKINDKAEMCLSIQSKPFSCRNIYRLGDKYYKYRMNDGGQMERIVRYRQFIEGKSF